MKQGTLKTLGVAALGAALAAGAAGTANAAPVADSTATGALDSVSGEAAPVPGGEAHSEGNLLGGLPTGGITDALGGGLPVG